MDTLSKKVIEKIIEMLRNAVTELEEFELKFALGEVEAADQYENIKKKLRELLLKMREVVKDHSKEIDARIAQLLEILGTGRVETKELFDEQREKIVASLDKLLEDFKSTGIDAELYSTLISEFEKFKIKMEILRLKFALKKMDWKQEWESGKKELNKKISELEQQMRSAHHQIQENNEEFFAEMRKAYAHLKKAFQTKI
jgi:hypothetical protein